MSRSTGYISEDTDTAFVFLTAIRNAVALVMNCTLSTAYIANRLKLEDDNGFLDVSRAAPTDTCNKTVGSSQVEPSHSY